MKKSKRDKWDITLKASIPVFRDLEGEKEEQEASNIWRNISLHLSKIMEDIKPKIPEIQHIPLITLIMCYAQNIKTCLNQRPKEYFKSRQKLQIGALYLKEQQ